MKELSALEYHRGTVHPGGEFFDPGHRYDPRDRPPRVKEYPRAETVDLPEVEPSEGPDALNAIQRQVPKDSPDPMDLQAVARLLHFSAGVTTWLDRPPLGRIPFRAASCTGALYHIEIYLGWAGSDELQPGLYHYQPEAHRLARLRQGNPEDELAQFVPTLKATQSGATLIFTSDYWRNAVKYQARAYRHAFWDAGTILANSLALSESFGWPWRLSLGFVDDQMERLLGIQDRPEVPLFVLQVGEAAGFGSNGNLGELLAEAEPVSGFPSEWPAIEAVHRGTSLADQAEVEEWTSIDAPKVEVPLQEGPTLEVPSVEGGGPKVDSLESVIKARGSSRAFRTENITKDQLVSLLNSVKGAVRPGAVDAGLNHLFLIINAVDDVEPGAYLYRPEQDQLKQLAAGTFRQEAQRLALGQRLGGSAAVNFYWLTDLYSVVDSLGDRGYRLSQLQAAEAAGRGYLASYALGIGATGLTFYDQAVVDFFSPASQDMAVMFLLAVGVPG